MKIGIALIGCLALFSCTSPTGGGGGGSNATRVVAGTIVVNNSAYWSYVKIGVFSGGSSGTYTHLDTGTTVMYPSPAVGTYQVVDNNLNAGAAVPVTPLVTASFTGSGATSRPYSIELPSAVPGASVRYFFTAWYDTNSDGNLDLKDAFVGDTNYLPTEFNRLATKATTNTSNAPTTISINDFVQSQDLSGSYTGKYKYRGYDDASSPYNEQLELDTSNNSGFNFNVSAASGW